MRDALNTFSPPTLFSLRLHFYRSVLIGEREEKRIHVLHNNVKAFTSMSDLARGKKAKSESHNPNGDDDNIAKLLQLAEIFPDKPIDELKTSLDDAAGDLELTVSLVLSGSDSVHREQLTKDVQPKVTTDNGTNPVEDNLLELYSMFPDIDTRVITSYYNSEGNSLYNTICDLLSYEMLSVEDKGEQQLLEERLAELRTKQSTKNSWSLFREHVSLILKYTQVDERTARQYYYKHFFHPIPTIVAIIHEQKRVKAIDRNVTVNETKTKTKNRAKHNFSRVQSQRGFAYTRGHIPLRYTATATTTSSSSTVKNHHSQTSPVTTKPGNVESKQLYVYSDSDPKLKALRELVRSSPNLSGINPAFLRDALTYYRGDTEKTLDLCCLLAEQNGIKYSFLFDTPDGVGHRLEEHTHSNLTVTTSRPPTPSTPSKGSKHGKTAETLGISKHREAIVSNERQLRDLFNTYKLDFHGYLPQEAESILRLALERWWNEEIMLRERNTIRLNLIEVRFVQPLIVITGRGIHSVGGVSKVRIQVKKLLENEMFVFDERPSFFTVYGKKSY